MCDKIVALGKKGKSKTQMAAHLNIARSTFDRYIEEHEEFREAYELADTHSQALWEQLGMGGLAKGHLFNDRAWQFQVRNRWPASYRQRAGVRRWRDHQHQADADRRGAVTPMADPKPATRPTCTLTSKQAEANQVLGGPARHIALWGGSRSGKTFLLVRAILVRALKEPGSRHMIARLRKAHVVASVGRDTLPKVSELCFPGVPYKLDHSECFVTLPNRSEIWLGGLDDKERVDKILGTEFATIFLNECSQIPLASVDIVRTQLAQKTKLVNRMLFDLNPQGRATTAIACSSRRSIRTRGRRYPTPTITPRLS